jgi:TIGR03009 family protein
MSSRIVPLTALSVMLLVIFWAVVATAQQPGAQPVGGQFLPVQPNDLQPGQQQQQFGQVAPVQPGAAQPGLAQPFVPQAPFQLNPQEQAFVDRILDDWQTVSSRVKTLKADFALYDYNSVFSQPAPGEPEKPIRVTTGSVRYAAPDKGHYETQDGEKWVCTGTAIFEFNKQLQKVREYRLPPQMQGQAISDGPMPFVFGVEKKKMNDRYWLRVITPAGRNGEVWLEAYPKLAKDAASFKKIEVILKFTLTAENTIADLQPFALNLIRQNEKERSAYTFQSMSTNNLVDGFKDNFNWFVTPKTPSGWSHELADDGTQPDPQPGTAPSGPPPSASGIGAVPLPVVPR